MSAASKNYRKITTKVLLNLKKANKKISMLTAYDYTFAKIIDKAGIEVILVGDSASNVMAGYDTTLPITLDEMIYHAKSVMRAVTKAFVVVDMPFGSYQGNSHTALETAIRIMKETGANAVKMEGGKEIVETIKVITSSGIPVMGHLGLVPQSINKFGTYVVRARNKEEANKLREDILLLEEAGCFAVVLEKIPAILAQEVTKSVKIPTIGIGAGQNTDGQVLVIHDMLGLTKEFNPSFLRRYADLHNVITTSVKQYIKDVKNKDFPNKEEQY